MRRRQFLLTTLSATLSILLAQAPAAAAGRRAERRLRPADPDWPDARQWAALDAAVGGNLITVEPLASPCGAAAGNVCPEGATDTANPFQIGDQPAGTQLSGWFGAWSSARSVHAVAVRNATDVAVAVDFARTRRLRLVVKGGGHSYQGNSNAPDSLLIWTRRMNDVVLHDAFVAAGCSASQEPCPAVSLGAGAMWIDAYDSVTTMGGRYVQGGGCTTVGVAGLVQSGGFGSFSKAFGTAAASLLEVEIVTADGRVRVANACRDPDLFWAVKGGGGGSWGIVTRLTLRTHDLPEHFGSASGTIAARSDEAFLALVRRFIGFYRQRLLNPHWGEQILLGPDRTMRISMNCQGLDAEAARRVWRPFFDAVAADPELEVTGELRAGAMAARHWWDVAYRRSRGNDSMIADPRPAASPAHAWWSGDREQVGAFLYAYDSVWLPEALLADGQSDRLVRALVAASRHHAIQLHFNKGLAGASDEVRRAAGATATNPDMLDAFALAIVDEAGPPAYPDSGAVVDPAAAHRAARAVADAMRELRVVAPDSGSYVSESNYFQAGWQRSHWGRNYPRLRGIKAQYDPGGLFYAHHGVGSEGWSDDGFTWLEEP